MTDAYPDSAEGASRILASMGWSATRLDRCPSRTNSVWATSEVVIKISLVSHTSDLFDEVELVSHLPDLVGAPRALATGRLDGHAWSAWRREPGRNLGELWGTMSVEQRQEAFSQTCRRVAALSVCDSGSIRLGVAPMAFSYRALDPFYAEQLLAEAAVTGWLDHDRMRSLAGLLWAMHEALSEVPHGLVHADAHLHNFLFGNCSVGLGGRLCWPRRPGLGPGSPQHLSSDAG